MDDLQAIGNDIWLAEGEMVDFYGFPYPTRMVLVRLASGLLWIWSPIALSTNLRSEIDALGQGWPNTTSSGLTQEGTAMAKRLCRPSAKRYT